MQVSIDLCVVPIGVDVSVSPYVAACVKLIQEAGLSYRINANNTEIEGDWDAVFAVVKRCHETVHAMGAPRIISSLRVNTRTDKLQSMDDKIHSVHSKIGLVQP